jgi:hypothetical protein
MGMQVGSKRRWVVGVVSVAATVFLVWRGVSPRLHTAPRLTGARSSAGEATDAPRAQAPQAVRRAPISPSTGGVAKPSPVATGTAAEAPVASTSGARAETVFRAPWGGRPGELGKKEAHESAPEGPMSFAVDEHGRAFVLDQVNFRVEVFEPGHEPKTVSLPSDTFQDIALAKNDELVLLDRLSTSSLAFVDGSGKVTHEIGLVGRGVSDAGDVTALFQRDDGIWIEVGHQNLVRIADADGNPDVDRTIVQGRFAADGKSVLRASRSGDSAAYVARKIGGASAAPIARVSFPMPIQELSALETDARGRIFLGASLAEEADAPPFDILGAADVVVVLSPSGSELARVELPANLGAEESFRRIRVGADGALYHLHYDETGATLQKVWL